MIRIGPHEERIILEIKDQLSRKLDSVGLFYRVFTRIKTPQSINKKLSEKEEKYRKENKKMQDLFGLRVTVYFSDDEEIAMELAKKIFTELPESHSIDVIDGEKFAPIRCNLIFKIPKDLENQSSVLDHDLIDKTFEIQFRTVFSEGWHEIEHDLRYKCRPDWEQENFLSRQLNGQLAILESSNWTLLKIFDELAHTKYKEHKWSSFLRNVLRIRFSDDLLSQPLELFLEGNKEVPRKLLKQDRNQLLIPFANLTTHVPLLMDNVIFVLNRTIIKDSKLKELESHILTKILDNSYGPF